MHVLGWAKSNAHYVVEVLYRCSGCKHEFNCTYECKNDSNSSDGGIKFRRIGKFQNTHNVVETSRKQLAYGFVESLYNGMTSHYDCFDQHDGHWARALYLALVR